MLFNIILHAYQIYFENFWVCFFLSPLQHYYNMTIPEYHHTNIDIMISVLQYYLSNITGRRFAAARVSTFYKHQLFSVSEYKNLKSFGWSSFQFWRSHSWQNKSWFDHRSKQWQRAVWSSVAVKKERKIHWNFGN